MQETIIDASILAKFILKEPGWKNLAKLFKRAKSVDLIAEEVANAIWKVYYRGLIDLDDAKKRFRALKILLGANIELENGLKFLDEAFEIALNYKITIYDALYLALAKRVPNSILFTSDNKQYEICVKMNLNCKKI